MDGVLDMPPPSDLDPAKLYANLTTDPRSLGYAPYITAGEHEILAQMLNEDRSGVWIRPDEAVTWEIVQSKWNPTELEAMTADAILGYDFLFKHPTVDYRAQIFADATNYWNPAFGTATITRDALMAIKDRAGSEAEIVFAPASITFPYTRPVVTHLDVAYALATEGGTIPE